MNDQIIINYLLSKQSLIHKQSIGQLTQLIHQQLGLHSTDYLTPYISLWNRIEDFDPEELFNKINSHELIRKRAYRGTVFVIDKDLLSLINVTSKVFAINWFKGFEKHFNKMNLDITQFKNHVLELFNKHKELTVSELKKHLADTDLLPKNMISPTLRYFELDGLLTRTSHRYPTDKVIRYGLVQSFFPDIFKKPKNVDNAFEELFMKYLKQYGPISFDDYSWWLPTTKTKAKQLIEKYKEEINEIQFNNQTYIIHKSDFDKLQNYQIQNNSPIVNFLPYEDHFPKSYTKRDWFLKEELVTVMLGQERMTMGQLWPSIWLNGKIVGKWEIAYQDKAKTSAKIEITHLENKTKLAKNVQDMIEEQRNNLERFINERLLSLNQKKK
jgi:hypothetical protein